MNAKQVASVIESIKTTFPDFKVTPANFKAPSKEFVFAFYSTIFDEFGLELSKVLQFKNHLPNEAHPELFQNTLPYINVCKFINGFLQKISPTSEPFGLSDLISPTPSRTLAFISMTMNFVSFADTSLSDLRARYPEITERKERFSALLKEREELLSTLNRQATCKANSIDQAEQIKLKTRELLELEEEIKSMDNIIESRKVEIDNIRKKVTSAQEKVCKLQNEVKDLELQLVQSPDAIRSEHAHLNEKLAECKQRLNDAQINLTGKKDIIRHLDEIDKSQDARHAVVSNIIKTGKEVMEATTELDKTSQRNMSVLSKISDTEGKKGKLKEDYSKLCEDFVAVQLKWDKNKSSLEENLRHKKEEKCTLEAEHTAKLEDALAKKEEADKRIRECESTYETLCDGYEKTYEKLMEKEKEFIKKKEEELQEQRRNFLD